MKNRIIIFAFIISVAIQLQAQNSFSNKGVAANKKRTPYYAANLNILAIWNSPILVANPEFEYNLNRFLKSI